MIEGGHDASGGALGVCLLAAENDLIPGGKVGGIGDVIRDLPPALAREGVDVTVIVPAYGAFHELTGARTVAAFSVPFGGSLERVELHELTALSQDGVRQYVLHHPVFAIGGRGVIYCDDPPDRPFARDASKFALFSLAALTVVRDGHLGPIDVLHLHDWHAALAAVLLRFDPTFAALRGLHTVFGIHNLALQGIRPLARDHSSLERWFPHLAYVPEALTDPRWHDCLNPVAAAVRHCDRVHTVSPTYARDIVRPNDPTRGFHGGEGLERDLAAVDAEGRLTGIVNGIVDDLSAEALVATGDEVPSTYRPHGWRSVTTTLSHALLATLGGHEQMPTADYLAHQRLLAWGETARPTHLLTSVGRLTTQKVALLLHRIEAPSRDGDTGEGASGTREVLDILLERLAARDGALVLLGSGDAALERRCQRIAARHPHFCFLCRYSAALSRTLFGEGDLFLMPSSFEPCGISQMLAMRNGQPPLVHAVGGLADTVEDGVDGFAFSGDSVDAQAHALLRRVDEILTLREQDRETWQTIVDTARARRFPWRESARRYIDELYTQP